MDFWITQDSISGPSSTKVHRLSGSFQRHGVWEMGCLLLHNPTPVDYVQYM